MKHKQIILTIIWIIVAWAMFNPIAYMLTISNTIANYIAVIAIVIYLYLSVLQFKWLFKVKQVK